MTFAKLPCNISKKAKSSREFGPKMKCSIEAFATMFCPNVAKKNFFHYKEWRFSTKPL